MTEAASSSQNGEFQNDSTIVGQVDVSDCSELGLQHNEASFPGQYQNYYEDQESYQHHYQAENDFSYQQQSNQQQIHSQESYEPTSQTDHSNGNYYFSTNGYQTYDDGSSANEYQAYDQDYGDQCYQYDPTAYQYDPSYQYYYDIPPTDHHLALNGDKQSDEDKPPAEDDKQPLSIFGIEKFSFHKASCFYLVSIVLLTIIIVAALGKLMTQHGHVTVVYDFLDDGAVIDEYADDKPVVSAQSKPNFVIIVADDLGWTSLGHDDNELKSFTPNLSDLAGAGLIMTNFYAQEVCSPSRASLLTGRYPLTVGMQYGMVAANAEWGLSLEEITIAEVLRDNDYSTHMLGKWHLGYFSPLFLPTARGFDTFMGYLNGENYYWSKCSPDYPEHVDLMSADASCFAAYTQPDIHNYSTLLYTNHAVELLTQQAADKPFLLYIAYQAVHDPFVDYGKFKHGLPDEYLDGDVLDAIHSTVRGSKRQEYVKSLNLLDTAVGTIRDTLESTGLIDNTFLVFMSDNGGCYLGGGKNAPLRGSKGALFEGGIKVDSFIYSPKLDSPGSTYDGLMHVSDWFPTILSLADIAYAPSSDHTLDGVNQVPGWEGSTPPRTTMLYNMYIALTDFDFSIWTNGSFAVRDSQYKLMHTYNDSRYAAWYDADVEYDADDDLDDTENRCAQQFVTGDFVYWFFDLEADPYETTNLYDSTEEEHVEARAALYELLPSFSARARTKIAIKWSVKAMKVWEAAGNRILPWANEDKLVNADKVDSYPVLC